VNLATEAVAQRHVVKITRSASCVSYEMREIKMRVKTYYAYKQDTI